MSKQKLLFCLLFVSICSQAQLLWEINGNGLKKPSYIFGTNNFYPVQSLDKIPGLFKAFEASNIVIGEVLLNSVDVMGDLQKSITMTDGSRISKMLNTEEIKKVDSALMVVLKLNLSQVDLIRPDALSTLFKNALYTQTLGLTDEIHSDNYFQLLAIDRGKKLLGFETTDEQVKRQLERGSLKNQANELVKAVTYQDSVLTDMKKTIEYYNNGDLENLYKLSEKKMTVSEHEIADKRILTWNDKLIDLLTKDSNSYFIAIDASFLGGEIGMIKSLQEKGYKVKPVLSK